MHKIGAYNLNIDYTLNKIEEGKKVKKPIDCPVKPVQNSSLELMSNINRPLVKKSDKGVAFCGSASFGGMNDTEGISPKIASIIASQADWDPYSKLEYDMARKNLVNASWNENRVKELYGFISRIGEDKIKELMDNEKLMLLFSKGNVSQNALNHILNLDEKQLKGLEACIEEFVQDMPEGADVEIYELQNGSGFELIAKKEGSSSDGTVLKISTLDEKGQITKGTAEYSDNGFVASEHCFKSDRSVIINYKPKEKKSDIISQIEIVNPKSGEAPYIIYTRESDILLGAYETIKYDLAKYPDDLDVIKAINDGTITGGEILSEVKANDGVINYLENYEQNGCKINRNYKRTVDNNGAVSSVEYSYNIADENGKALLNMQRSWVKNSDDTTTTIINGKKYIASFDETNMQITIKAEDGTIHTINLKDIMSSYEKYSDLDEVKTYNSNEEMQKDFLDFCKTLGADQLISLSKYVKEVLILNDVSLSAYNYSGKLDMGLDYSTVAHELGHAKDELIDGTFDTNILRTNEELIEIYNEEMEAFKSEHTASEQEIVKYFSQKGGSFGTGLSELIAETNMLMATYGNDNNGLSSRAQYLVRYFPKTVAKAGELLGY